MKGKLISQSKLRAGDFIRVADIDDDGCLSNRLYIVLAPSDEEGDVRCWRVDCSAGYREYFKPEYSRFYLQPRKRWISGKIYTHAESGYQYAMLMAPSGRGVLITAGCRTFTSFAQAHRHWTWTRVTSPREGMTLADNADMNKFCLSIMNKFKRRRDQYIARRRAA